MGGFHIGSFYWILSLGSFYRTNSPFIMGKPLIKVKKGLVRFITWQCVLMPIIGWRFEVFNFSKQELTLLFKP